jgi:hypothetical protein
MMLCVVAGGSISGQLSCAGGHYKLLGIIGSAIMATDCSFSRLGVDTGYATAVIFIAYRSGTGMTMPVYTIAVQTQLPTISLSGLPSPLLRP